MRGRPLSFPCLDCEARGVSLTFLLVLGTTHQFQSAISPDLCPSCRHQPHEEGGMFCLVLLQRHTRSLYRCEAPTQRKFRSRWGGTTVICGLLGSQICPGPCPRQILVEAGQHNFSVCTPHSRTQSVARSSSQIWQWVPLFHHVVPRRRQTAQNSWQGK